MTHYRFLADVTVVLHLVYASFIVFGFVAVLLGTLLNWSWVRNVWFRLIHLLMIGGVAAEACCGIACPLTILENYLRSLGGDATYPGSFIGTLANEVLFINAPEWFLSALYIAFFLFVVATFVFSPPRRPVRRAL